MIDEELEALHKAYQEGTIATADVDKVIRNLLAEIRRLRELDEHATEYRYGRHSVYKCSDDGWSVWGDNLEKLVSKDEALTRAYSLDCTESEEK